MLKPLTVYLDSSDFSILSNPSQRTSEIIAIERELLSLQETGAIELRFSYAHILEAAPVSKDSIQFAKQRFSYISEVCANKCLASHIEIIEHEVKALAITSRTSQFDIFNDNSMWLPKIDKNPESDLLDTINTIKEEIALLPDRKRRRQATRTAFYKNGQVNSNFLFKDQSLLSSILLEMENKYPLTRAEAETYVKNMFLVNTNESCSDILINSFKDVGRLGDWYEKQWDRTLPVSSHLRDIGDRLSEGLRVANSSVQRNYAELKEAGYEEAEIGIYCKKIIKDISKSLPIQFVEGASKKLNLAIDVEKIDWANTPSILTVCNMCACLASKGISQSARSRSFKVSDFGDITHAYYIPYVDFFRADKFMASLIQEFKTPLKTTVVGSIKSLVPEINKKLNE